MSNKFYYLQFRKETLESAEAVRLLRSPDGYKHLSMYYTLGVQTIDDAERLGRVERRFADGDTLPLTAREIANLLMVTEEDAQEAIDAWTECKMATTEEDGTLCLTLIPQMVTSQSKGASYMRTYRQQKQDAQDTKEAKETKPKTKPKRKAEPKPDPTLYAQYGEHTKLTSEEFERLAEKCGSDDQARRAIAVYDRWKGSDGKQATERRRPKYEYKDFSYISRYCQDGWIAEQMDRLTNNANNNAHANRFLSA